ncbi:MAG: hypothetical protein ABW185_26350 [Sedimenticola sp.]
MNKHFTIAGSICGTIRLLKGLPENKHLAYKMASNVITRASRANPIASRQVHTNRNYNLNIDRALKMKIKSCTAVKTNYEVTGGGITGIMDTARFELFRSACTAFYSDLPPTEGYCVMDLSSDKQGKAVVQQTYKIRDCEQNGQPAPYTLNLYTTNNRILINGKGTDKFITEHLPLIHEYIGRALKDWNFANAQQINNVLAEEMQHLLDQRQHLQTNASPLQNSRTSLKTLPHRQTQLSNDENSTATRQTLPTDSSPIRGSTPQPEVQSKAQPSRKRTDLKSLNSKQESSNIICNKCNKKCLTRAAVCELGEHWVHYHCDKLTTSEIDRLINDNDAIYNCKHCLTRQDTTLLKLPFTRSPGSLAHSDQSEVTLTIPTTATPSFAQDILSEELSATCTVCSLELTGDEAACTDCSSVCHLTCMDQHHNEMCISCAALAHQSELHVQQPTIDNLPPTIPTISSPKQHISVTPEVTLRNESKATKNSQGANVIKQRELRQQEMKLKKWEEELKIREARNADTLNESKRLEEYLIRTEARNTELEKSVRTLQRKISLLESSERPSANQAPSQTNSKDQQYVTNDLVEDELINGVRKQVTQFVLRKVSEQLSHLEDLDSLNNQQARPQNMMQREQSHLNTSQQNYNLIGGNQLHTAMAGGVKEPVVHADRGVHTGTVPPRDLNVNRPAQSILSEQTEQTSQQKYNLNRGNQLHTAMTGRVTEPVGHANRGVHTGTVPPRDERLSNDSVFNRQPNYFKGRDLVYTSKNSFLAKRSLNNHIT